MKSSIIVRELAADIPQGTFRELMATNKHVGLENSLGTYILDIGKLRKELFLNKEKECEIAGRPFIFETDDDKGYFNNIGYNNMSRELKKNKIDSSVIAAKISIVEREFKEASFSVKWPIELNEFLEEFVGNLFYIESPPVEIVGGLDFVIDMYMPQRITTAIIATKNLLSALIYYIKNDIGPIPDDWVQRDGRFLIPTPDLIRFRLKTFNPHMSPAEGQVGTWSPKSGPAASMNGEDCTSLSTAVGIFEEPGICFFLYGGASDPNLTDLGTSYSYLSRVLGGAENKRKSENPQAFLKSLRRRFPNYSGVLLEMGWAPKDIPLTPDKLPVKMYDMYKRAELIAHQDLKERVYKISKMTGNVAQMVSILRSLDEDIILKKENVKSERASRDLGLKAGNPDWL